MPARSFFNVLGYQNPQYEELAGRQATMFDAEQRKNVVPEIERIVAEDGATPVGLQPSR